MKKKYFAIRLSLVFMILTISFFNLIAQEKDCNYVLPHQADTWVFGINSRIDFTDIPPSIVPTTINYGMPSGSSTISDETGSLLFFTNGKTVWNKSYLPMDNGNDLAGGILGGQNSIIIPNPGNSMQYFIFTTNIYVPGYSGSKGINYSTVDFTNNNLGTVTSKNNLLFKENSKTLCAVKHGNGTDFWVIFHGFGANTGNKFYSFLVDTSGVVTAPVVSTTGYFQDGDINNQATYMKASPNGRKLANTLPIDGVVEILDFDNETGMVSNPVISNDGYLYFPFGVEFSPDNTKLYVSTSPLDADTSFLIQFDILQSQPFANPIVINKFRYNKTLSDSTMQGLQLGVDGKIYVTKTTQGGGGLSYLGVIYNPNRPGIESNYNKLDNTSNNGLYLNGGKSQAGLPDFISNYLDIPHFYFFNQCHNDTTKFQIRNTANVDPSWDFKDTGGISILTDPLNPKHIFSEAGTYDVELVESYDGIDYSFNNSIVINPLPSVDIGQGSNIMYILPNSSIRLDAGEGYDIYSWNTGGSTGQYLDVNEEGIYSVSVTDFNCCTNSDTVEIRFASITYPTAFNPNSPIVENQVFNIAGEISGIASYQLRVFNRWGQLIFDTDDPTMGWDGNVDGSPAPLGTYVYSAVLTSFESGIQASIDIKNTGTVTLIR